MTWLPGDSCGVVSPPALCSFSRPWPKEPLGLATMRCATRSVHWRSARMDGCSSLDHEGVVSAESVDVSCGSRGHHVDCRFAELAVVAEQSRLISQLEVREASLVHRGEGASRGPPDG